jgi:hypothetical protein
MLKSYWNPDAAIGLQTGACGHTGELMSLAYENDSISNSDIILYFFNIIGLSKNLWI